MRPPSPRPSPGAEAERYVPANMRQAGFAPIKTANHSPNLLLATWTLGGEPLNDVYTKLLGQNVYSLTDAAQLLYEAYVGGNERVGRDLLSADFLAGIASDLKERSLGGDLVEITQDRALNQEQKRLSVLYLLGPGLPFAHAQGGRAFTTAAQLLTRTATSALDFAAAEESFKVGLLPIWLRATAPLAVKTALPATTTALDFRRFLHKASPSFPLWIGETSFASPAQLAAYIRRDEDTWKMVYGSLAAGFLSPWLHALGRADILERQAQLAEALLGPGVETTSEPGRQLAVQALLEALDPETVPPSLDANLHAVDLTGLSGETPAERTLTLTNTTGGPLRVVLALEPTLVGVHLSATELFFSQRAPGQRLAVVLTGNPVPMPRDGQHTAQLVVRTPYAVGEVPVRASAVFPQKEFWQFVGGAALALALVFGAIRLLLGVALDSFTNDIDYYQTLVSRGTLLPLDYAQWAGNGPGLIFLGFLLLLGACCYGFVRTLRKLSKPKAA